MRSRAAILGLFAGLICLGLVAAPAVARGRGDIAALQVALRAAGVYGGAVDGVRGPGMIAALRRLQARAGLRADGIVGPETRRALGRSGRHRYGSRAMRAGDIGWDIAVLQFKLAVHGFPAGSFDGALGPRSVAALLRFQRWTGRPIDGIAGRGTLVALRSAPPRSPAQLLWPLRVPVGNGFGPHRTRFHAGIDLPAAFGTPVAAAGFGTVVFAGFHPTGWGNLVIVSHRFGLQTLYAHLSAIDVRVGQFVPAGGRVGRVGATGSADGPHLHFEVRLRGANVDPLSALR